MISSSVRQKLNSFIFNGKNRKKKFVAKGGLRSNSEKLFVKWIDANDKSKVRTDSFYGVIFKK